MDEQLSGRYFYIDVLRGIAIVMMIAFHFTYDLNYFHFVDVDFYHVCWFICSTSHCYLEASTW